MAHGPLVFRGGLFDFNSMHIILIKEYKFEIKREKYINTSVHTLFTRKKLIGNLPMVVLYIDSKRLWVITQSIKLGY